MLAELSMLVPPKVTMLVAFDIMVNPTASPLCPPPSVPALVKTQAVLLEKVAPALIGKLPSS